MRLAMSTALSVGFSALLLGAPALQAHTLQTKAGNNVSHIHQSSCANGCLTNTYLESSPYNFSSSHRFYSSTWAWNCHGRTFDNRQSWTNYADPWLASDAPFCPVNPAVGQTVIWWGSDGKTSHSVTITGSWNNLSTQVMSKYGAYGQYRHALSNAVAVYGSNWSVTGFGLGTTIYSGMRSEAPSPVVQEVDPGKKLLEQRKDMPWYEAVLQSEIHYALEHPRLVSQSAGLREETRARLLETVDEMEQIDILLEDLQSPAHYEVFHLYNRPSLSEDFIKEIEAGKLLALLSNRKPELKQVVTERLTGLVTERKGEIHDTLRGAAIHFLTRVSTPEERKTLKNRFSLLSQSSMTGPGAGKIPSYTEYYLQKMDN